MIVITKNITSVKVDLSAVPPGITKYKTVYILRNKADFVWLEYDEKWVEICLTDGDRFRLDMNAQYGLPVSSIDNQTPLNNADLCEKLSDLKLL